MIFFYSLYSKGVVRLFFYIFILPALWVSASTVPLEYGEFQLFQTPVTYDLNTSVSIIDESDGGSTVGYRITAIVRLEPIWSDQKTDFLLKFHLESPKLYVTGTKGEAPAEAAWGSPAEAPFYARLTHGAVQAAYLDERDPLDLLNYKKSIVSLFQFRAIDGETKETDVSGLCDVVYQSTSLTTIHKTKTRCSEDESLSWTRHATYTLSRGLEALQRVRARERVEPRAALRALAAPAARAELALERRAAPPGAPAAPAAAAPGLPQALDAIPAHLQPVALTLQPAPEDWEAEEDLDSALSELVSLEGGAGAAAGAGGAERDARAALRALRALAGAARARVLRALRDDSYYPVLPSLYRLVGQSGSGAALAAAVEHLQLAAADAPRALGAQLLAGAARAAEPDAAARAALLALARAARAPPVADAALLAAAAQASRAGPDAAREVRDLVTKQLAKCEDSPCRIVRLHALANLRTRAAADALLAAARGARAPGEALAALDALDALDSLEPQQLAALQDIAMSGGRALEVRASALDVVLRRSPAALGALAGGLRRAPAELRRVFWQRVRQLADDGADAARLLRGAAPLDRGWLARAAPGLSSVLARAPGWRLGARAPQLRARQLAAAGALRRAELQLALLPDDELLAVEVWMRGMESLAGTSEAAAALDEGAPAAAPRAELRLRVDGAHQPAVPLFDGQAELLGHIWAGTGSAPTPVLRAERARLQRARAAPLLAGARLALSAAVVHSFAVDAQAQVSLWSRSGRAGLELRAALASEARLSLAAPGGALLALEARSGAAPRLRLDAHMDFYDEVTLCVRAELPPHEAHTAVSRRAGRRAGRGAGRARRERRWARAGHTLSLGADNDRACRHIAAEDHHY